MLPLAYFWVFAVVAVFAAGGVPAFVSIPPSGVSSVSAFPLSPLFLVPRDVPVVFCTAIGPAVAIFLTFFIRPRVPVAWGLSR